MRFSNLHLFLLATISSCSAYTSPFLPPGQPANANAPLIPRADGNCAANEASCSSLGAPNLCCPARTICTLDPLNNPACCPLNAACTGIVSAVPLPTSTITATITPAPTPGIAVPNAYFPYTYLPTTFANAAVCSSSLASCQAVFSTCTSSLGSPAAAGVTVVANNGAVTVLAPVGVASAQQICLSLSSRACYGLQLANCATYTAAAGTAQATFVAGTVVAAGSGARRRSNPDWVLAGLEFALGVLGFVV